MIVITIRNARGDVDVIAKQWTRDGGSVESSIRLPAEMVCLSAIDAVDIERARRMAFVDGELRINDHE